MRAGGKILVYVRAKGPVAGAAKAIEQAGATVVGTSAHFGVVTAAVAPSDLQALAGLSEVKAAFEALAPIQARSGTGEASVPTTPITNAPPGCNPVVSEGDTSLGASAARSDYGIDGTGVKVGVLSDSYNALGGAAAGVSAGELPGPGNCQGYTTPVSVIEDYSGGEDEGRGMLEAVHDLAPDSTLGFATAWNGLFEMADNIEALRDWGANVIADDVSYLDEPMFQEGPIGLAIDNVTASGVSYFSSAGNDNVIVNGNDVGSYEAPSYRPTSCPDSVAAVPGEEGWPYDYTDCHNFSTSGDDNGAGFTLEDGYEMTVELQWAEPWNGVSTDLDFYLVDSDTGEIVAGSTDPNTGASGTQEPFEILDYLNDTGASENVELVVARYQTGPTPPTGTPRLKYVLLDNGPSGLTYAEYNASTGGDIVGPTIFGHNGGANTISVAAVPYNDLSSPEFYSSHGPITYYYGPADGTTVAAPLATPVVSDDPDVAAVDCAANSFFGFPIGGVWRFCGTSQAAPHAAAVAALLLSRFPFTPAQVASRLEETAHPIADGTSASVGAGLVNADDAADAPALGFSQSSFSVGEASGQATVTIRRFGNSAGTLSVEIKTEDGTAHAGADYTAVDTPVTFGDGDTAPKTVAIPIKDDALLNGNRTFKVTFTDLSTGFWEGPSSITVTIVDDEIPVRASFSASSTSGLAPWTVTFTNASTGARSYSWAFGDGTSSTATSPAHTYTNPGSFTATLTATGRTGTSKATATITVLVSPVPAFSVSRLSGYAPLTVRFRNRSRNATSYLWSFGDAGPFSDEDSPTHTFTSAGTYTVTLIARGPNGSKTKSTTVVVAPARPDLSVKVRRKASGHKGLSAFAITVTNKGGARDERVKIRIKLPAGACRTHLVFHRHVCKRAGRQLTCSLSKLNPQTTASLKLTLAAAKRSRVSVSASGKRQEITTANNASFASTR